MSLRIFRQQNKRNETAVMSLLVMCFDFFSFLRGVYTRDGDI